MKTHYDTAIVGSGPAGSIAALTLARAGQRVVMIDRERQSSRKIGESLPSEARSLLQHLALLPLLESGRHRPSFGHRMAWGSSRLQYEDFISNPNGLGWHLDRARFDRDLLLAAENAGVEIIKSHAQDVFTDDAGLWRLEGPRWDLSSQWLIDATGRRAYIAAKLGAQRLRDSDLTAVYGWFKPLDLSDDPRPLIESAPDGWWYSARLPDSSLVAVFHTDAATAGKIARMPNLWNQMVAKTTHTRSALAGALSLGALQFHEACGARLHRFGGRNWLATGDAALSFDPLSSQGIFNALYAGLKAARAVITGDVIAYTERLQHIRTRYLSQTHQAYASETRFAAQAFWQRISSTAPYIRRTS